MMKQLQMLWAPKTVAILFTEMSQFAESKDRPVSTDESKKSGKAIHMYERMSCVSHRKLE